jgi:hypothetical protein
VIGIDEMDLWINESSTERAARFRTWSYVLGWQTFGGFNETYNMFPDADSFCDGLNCMKRERKKKKRKICFCFSRRQQRGVGKRNDASSAGEPRFDVHSQETKNITMLGTTNAMDCKHGTRRNHRTTRSASRRQRTPRRLRMLARVKNGSLVAHCCGRTTRQIRRISEERRAALLGRARGARSIRCAADESPLPLISYAYGVDVGNNFGPGASARNWDLQH